MQDFKNYAVQFVITAVVVYGMGTSDSGSIVQAGVISVLSSIVADQLMPYLNGQPAATI